jgi:ferritin-like metal-binding protein YciE
MPSTPTLNPTYDTGARGKTVPMISHPPERDLDADSLRAELPDTGLDMVFVADILSAMLTHERGGRHLYRSVAGRTLNPMLRSRYEEFGEETEHHAAVLEHLISSMGGDPQYVSPAARATEAAGKKIIESTFGLAGSLDVMTAEMAMLDGVLLAEAIDHANWTALDQLAGDMPAGDLRDRMRAAVDEVLSDEDEHLEWARQTRTKMVVFQAEHPTAANAVAKGEELMERVKNWFTD